MRNISRYANTMCFSGYSKAQRYNSFKGELEIYREIVQDVNIGKRKSIYRSGDEIRKAKIEKMDWANTSFLQGNTTNTISCPVTSVGVLKKRLDHTVRGKSNKTKNIEDGGWPIYEGLKMKGPMRLPGCVFGDPLCMVKADQQCDRSGVIYRIQCLTCLEPNP